MVPVALSLSLRAQGALNRLGTRLAVRLRGGVHPKHLVDVGQHAWYLDQLRPQDVVLDVGCGAGAHSLRAASRVRAVVGIDRDRAALARAWAAKAARAVQNVVWLCFDVDGPWRALDTVWPLPARQFSAVLLLDVLEHLRHRQDVLGQIRRLLTDDGRLFVTGPNRLTSWRQRLRAAGLDGRQDPDHQVEYSLPEFQAELEEAGFSVQWGPEPIVYDTPWAGVLDALGACHLGLYRRIAWLKYARAQEVPHEATGWAAVAVKAGEAESEGSRERPAS